MKIKELSERVNATKDIKKSWSFEDKQKAIDTLFSVKGTTGLGSGAFGVAFNVVSDLETVVKIASSSSSSFKKDGYLLYLSIVKAMQDNPYVPQINNIELIRPVNLFKKPYLKVELEKLVEGSAVTYDEALTVLKRICDKNFNDEEMSAIESKFNLVARRNSDTTSYGLIQMIKDICNNFIANINYDLKEYELEVKDEQLKDVLNNIKKFIDGSKSDNRLDLHTGNIMYRRTSTGMHLVITDPLV